MPVIAPPLRPDDEALRAAAPGFGTGDGAAGGTNLHASCALHNGVLQYTPGAPASGPCEGCVFPFAKHIATDVSAVCDMPTSCEGTHALKHPVHGNPFLAVIMFLFANDVPL